MKKQPTRLLALRRGRVVGQALKAGDYWHCEAFEREVKRLSVQPSHAAARRWLATNAFADQVIPAP